MKKIIKIKYLTFILPNIFFITYGVYFFLKLSSKLYNFQEKLGILLGILFSILISNAVLMLLNYIFTGRAKKK